MDPLQIAKIKRNMGRMIDQNAPDADIQAYLADEGATLDDIKNSPVAGPNDQISAPPHSLLGVAKTGALQGVADTIGLPDTVGRLFLMGSDYLNPGSKEYRAQRRAHPLDPTGSGNPRAYVKAAIDRQPEQMDQPGVAQRLEDFIFKYFRKDDAQTDNEKLLQMGARAASGGALTGGATAAPGAMIQTAIKVGAASAIGGVASEKAGQMTAGTKWEPWARFGAGLVAGGGALAGINKLTTAESILNKALTGYTAQDFQAADALIQQSRAAGVTITPAEALAQIRPAGNTPLMGIQRYAENAPESGPIMGRVMNNRPGENLAAVGGTLDNISPVPAAPTEVGPTIQNAAQRTLDQTRGAINAEARPFYQQAEAQSNQLTGLGVNPYAGPQWTAMQNNPAFRNALEQVRNDPLNANLGHLQDYDLQILDAVKKRMDLLAGRATNPGVGQQPDTVTAAAYDNARRQLRDMAGNAFPDYQTAREIGAEGRTNFLEPQGRAPIGQLSQTSDLTAQQNIMLPKLASEATPPQITAAVRQLTINGAADRAAELIRLKLQDVFNTALSNVKGSAEQYRGAAFANNISRYENQIQSLEAAVRALPGGAARWEQLDAVLQGLRAQGQRLPVGSATEFNRLLTEAAQQSGNIITMPLKAVQSMANLGRNAMQGLALRGSQRELANALTMDNVRGLQEIAGRPDLTRIQLMINALMGTGAQMPGAPGQPQPSNLQPGAPMVDWFRAFSGANAQAKDKPLPIQAPQ